MNEAGAKWISVVCITLGLGLIAGAVWYSGGVLGNVKWVFVAGGAVTALGAIRFRVLNSAEKRLKSEKTNLDAEKQSLREMKAEIEAQTRQLRKKEKEFMQKLITWHEWMEFPADFEAESGFREPSGAEALKQKDRAAADFLEHQTEIVFEKIRNNGYHEQDTFQSGLLMADVGRIFQSVAAIYLPDSKNPALETSIEQFLRAINRISMQLLVSFEQLPLDIQRYNLKHTYETIRKGLKAYGTYKSMEPYMPYLRPVYYLGRFALGSNPVTLGAGWAAGELVKEGGKMLSSHFSNRYALGLIHDAVFIIGNEAAEIYAKGYHHRSASWIYGAELTELTHKFPLSRDSIQAALKEIGGLTLRNEYDRLYFYRALGARTSARPEKPRYQTMLSFEERQQVADSLEKFRTRFVHGSPKELRNWRIGVEDRLGVRFRASEADMNGDLSADIDEEGLSCLAGFLMEKKRLNPEDLPPLLSDTETAGALEAQSLQAVIEKIAGQPPMIFDYPDYDISDRRIDAFIRDMMRLCVRVFPYGDPGYAVVRDLLRYFRREKEAAWLKDMERLFSDFLAEQLAPESPVKTEKGPAARALLNLLNAGEKPVFLYDAVEVRSGEAEAPLTGGGWELRLMGTTERLVLAKIPDQPDRESGPEAEICWTGGAGVYIEFEKGVLSDKWIIHGGMWRNHEPPGDTNRFGIVLSSGLMNRSAQYFQALENFVSRHRNGNPSAVPISSPE